MGSMTSPKAGPGKRAAVTWGLIALSAAGAVGATALAYSDAADSDSTSTAAPADNTWTTAPATTTLLPPGFNGAPLAPNRGVFTRSRDS
jgi:hypothetical protein